MSAKKEAADDFLAYCDAFFPKTVLSGSCSSWYNGMSPFIYPSLIPPNYLPLPQASNSPQGGIPNNPRIHGVWPGSAAHVTHIRFDPRWEDFNYTYKNASDNRFAYFGNGWTLKEGDPEADLVGYLRREDLIDLRDYHERWFEV